MSGNRYSEAQKEAVEKLRKKGMTYAEIRAIHPIPKSTLSVWLGEKYPAFFNENARLEHLRKIRPLSAAKLRRDKIARETIYNERGAATAQQLPVENLEFQKALLSMLYWAEGTKSKGTCTLTFANTDPRLVLLYISMLRNCFEIDETKIRIRLHIHYYHKRKETRRYWSELLKVPERQFGKLWIKPRSKTKKFRQNFKGICIVKYGGIGLFKEILALGEAISKRIISH